MKRSRAAARGNPLGSVQRRLCSTVRSAVGGSGRGPPPGLRFGSGSRVAVAVREAEIAVTVVCVVQVNAGRVKHGLCASCAGLAGNECVQRGAALCLMVSAIASLCGVGSRLVGGGVYVTVPATYDAFVAVEAPAFLRCAWHQPGPMRLPRILPPCSTRYRSEPVC